MSDWTELQAECHVICEADYCNQFCLSVCVCICPYDRSRWSLHVWVAVNTRLILYDTLTGKICVLCGDWQIQIVIWFMPWLVTCEIKLFWNIKKYFQCLISHVTTSEIISKLFQSLKLFRNNFRGLLQLVNIFQHVECRWNYSEIGPNFRALSAAEIILK